MFNRDEDEPNDPRRVRKTLVPLDIEDGERPPSLLRRIGKMFQKKKGKEDNSPRDGGADSEISDQYL